MISSLWLPLLASVVSTAGVSAHRFDGRAPQQTDEPEPTGTTTSSPQVSKPTSTSKSTTSSSTTRSTRSTTTTRSSTTTTTTRRPPTSTPSTTPSTRPPPPTSPTPTPPPSSRPPPTNSTGPPPIGSSTGVVDPSDTLSSSVSTGDVISSFPLSSSTTTGSDSLTFTLPSSISDPLGGFTDSTTTTETSPTFPLPSPNPDTTTNPLQAESSVPPGGGSSAPKGFLQNKTEAGLVLTLVSIVGLLMIGGLIWWIRRRKARRPPSRSVTTSDMDEFRGFQRANSNASTVRRPSTHSSHRMSENEPWHYQQPHRVAVQPLSVPPGWQQFADESAPVHYTIYPDIIQPQPVAAKRPLSPESTYDDQYSMAAAPRR